MNENELYKLGDPYRDRLFYMQVIHDLFSEHFNIELCWADCVLYAHEDGLQESISVCPLDPEICDYCGKASHYTKDHNILPDVVIEI